MAALLLHRIKYSWILQTDWRKRNIRVPLLLPVVLWLLLLRLLRWSALLCRWRLVVVVLLLWCALLINRRLLLLALWCLLAPSALLRLLLTLRLAVEHLHLTDDDLC